MLTATTELEVAMDSQADTVITDAGRELVCSCIKDDELRAHMFKHMGMADGSLCKTIGGSLKTLDEKRTMLEQLRKEVSSDYAETIDSGLEQLDTALDMLYNVDRDRGILLVSGVFYSEDERGHDTFDGPFPVASWDAAQTLMKQYVDDDPDEDWSESFWQIKLYTAEDLHDRPRAQASLIFAATIPRLWQTLVGWIGRTRLLAAISHIGRRRRQRHTFGHSRVSRLARYQRAFGRHRLRAHHARGSVHRRPFEREDAATED